MKDLVPTVTSNRTAAGPIPGHGVSLSPSPPHIKPLLTKAAVGGIMRRTAPFNCVWSVTFSVFLFFWVDTAVGVWGVDRTVHTAFLPLDISQRGQHQSNCKFLGSTVRVLYTAHKGRGERLECGPPLCSFLKTSNCFMFVQATFSYLRVWNSHQKILWMIPFNCSRGLNLCSFVFRLKIFNVYQRPCKIRLLWNCTLSIFFLKSTQRIKNPVHFMFIAMLLLDWFA